MAIKLIASDVDGTLVGHDQCIHPRDIAAIKKAVARGVVVTLATGRSYATALGFYKKTRMNGPLICLNGAQTRDETRIYHSRRLPAELSLSSLNFAQEKDLIPMFFDAQDIHVVTNDFRTLRENLLAAGFPDDSETGMLRVHPTFDAMEEAAESLSMLKILFVAPGGSPGNAPPQLAFCREELRRRIESGDFPEGGALTSSYWSNFELLPKGADKGLALAALADRYGFAAHEIMSIGDNENDIGMLRYAGVSVAMGNAPAQVRAIARHVTANVGDGGVADAIEAYAL